MGSAAGEGEGAGSGVGAGAGGLGGGGGVFGLGGGGGAGGMGSAGVKLLSLGLSAKGAAMMRVSMAADFRPLMSCCMRGKPQINSAWPMAATAAAIASWRCGGLGGAKVALGAVTVMGRVHAGKLAIVVVFGASRAAWV